MKRFVSLILSVCFLFSINTVSYAPHRSVQSPFAGISRCRWRKSIQIATTIYTQARLRTSLFCFLLYQLSLWWVKYRAQPEAIST